MKEEGPATETCLQWGWEREKNKFIVWEQGGKLKKNFF